tara:strand:+ start:59 stop:580 length:522 start_codon:yes stop_codon:yes gene_type:complete
MKTVADYNFKDDIKDGERGETIIANYLEGYGYKLINDNKNNKYDLKMLTDKNVETTIEVKTDVYCYPKRTVIEGGVEKTLEERDTGNMFVEKESRGKLSGISVTKASWFVMYFPYFKEAWFIRSSKLKELIDSNNFYVANGGDPGSNTKGYLIKRNFFKKHFKVRKIETEWEN